MPTFASASFTGTAYAELSTVDSAWTKLSGYTQDAVLGTSGAYVISNAANIIAAYRNTATPPSADYNVAAFIAKLSGNTSDPRVGVIGRAAAAADTYYGLVQYIANNQLRLFKVVASTFTLLGAVANTLSATAQQIELRMAGNQISGYLNGSLVIGPITDSSITAAGYAGIYARDSRQFGVADVASLDDFVAATAAGPATALTLTGPTTGTVGTASSNFTVAANGSLSANVTVTPSSGGGGGTFSPATLTLTSAATSGTFTYTATTTGAKTISVTNSGSLANPSAVTFTASAAGDTTPPTLTGAITIGTVTSTSIAMSWPAGADNVAVTSYEVSKDSGATWIDTSGTGLSYIFTGLAASTSYGLRVRAKDAAGNVSTPALAATQSTSAAGGATLTSSALKNNTGALHLSAAFEAFVLNATTGALIVRKTGLTSHASTGVVTFNDAALTAATQYRVVWRRTDTGAQGLEQLTAA